MSGASAAVGSSLNAPGSINDVRTQAHLLLGQRLGAIDLTPLLVYTVTGAPASALPFLAWQFDVLSPWWQLLAGPDSQTAIIQQAVALHRSAGTVSAITTILENLGFPIVEIQEGQNSWGGTQYPADEGWALFRVLVTQMTGGPQTYPASWDAVTDIDSLTNIDVLAEAGTLEPTPVTAAQETQAVQAINFFKPQRDILDSLWFIAPPTADAVAVSDFITIVAANFIQERPLTVADFVSVQGWALADTKTIAPLYDAHFYHAGINYGAPQPAVADSGLVINGTPTE